MERNGREGALNPWSVRHSAIYYGYEKSGQQCVILANPSENSLVERKLQAICLENGHDEVSWEVIRREPVFLLLLLLETYLVNWKDYINDRWHAYEQVVSQGVPYAARTVLPLSSPLFHLD